MIESELLLEKYRVQKNYRQKAIQLENIWLKLVLQLTRLLSHTVFLCVTFKRLTWASGRPQLRYAPQSRLMPSVRCSTETHSTW